MGSTEVYTLLLCTLVLSVVIWYRHWIRDFLTRSTVRVIRRVVAVAGIVLLIKIVLTPSWFFGIGFAELFLIEWILAS